MSSTLNISKHRARLIVLFAATQLAACSASADEQLIYFGSHRSGPGIGLSFARFDAGTGTLSKPELVMESSSPAFFAIHPGGRYLYACNETSTGAVSAIEIEAHTGRLTLLNQVPSGGADPCYLSLDRSGHYALVANYSSGTVAVFALNPDGRLGERTGFDQHTGSSVNPQRQTHAYAHSILTDPENRFALSADLGADRIYVYRFNERDGSLKPNDPPFATLPPGSGPRHLRFHPDGRGVYIVNELACTVVAANWNSTNGTLAPFQTISTLPAGFKGVNTCAEVMVHPNGKFLYASNRGHDSLAVFAIDSKTGGLTLVEQVSSAGKTPRNFTFDPSGKWLLCANHGSDNAVVFRVDEITGRLTQTGQPVPVPFPFCDRFLPVR